MMKKLILPLILILSLSFIGCKKDKNPNNDQSIFGTCATWHLNSSQFNSIDETANYNALKFTFCPDNTVTLANDLLSFNGNWYFLPNSANPQSMSLEFDFRGNESPYWIKLEGTWMIITLDNNLLMLQSADATTKLTFQKG